MTLYPRVPRCHPRAESFLPFFSALLPPEQRLRAEAEVVALAVRSVSCVLLRSVPRFTFLYVLAIAPKPEGAQHLV